MTGPRVRIQSESHLFDRCKTNGMKESDEEEVSWERKEIDIKHNIRCLCEEDCEISAGTSTSVIVAYHYTPIVRSMRTTRTLKASGLEFRP